MKRPNNYYPIERVAQNNYTLQIAKKTFRNGKSHITGEFVK